MTSGPLMAARSASTSFARDAQALAEFAQVRHGALLVAADVDAAQQGDPRGRNFRGHGSLPVHIPFGHWRVSTSDSPVSSRLLRLARMSGQPFDTAPISF